MTAAPQVNYQTNPSQYKHINLSFDGEIATLAINTSGRSEDQAFDALRTSVRQHLALPA